MEDKDIVVNGLDEIMHYSGEQMFYNDIFIRRIAEDALSLLKEQEAIEPKQKDVAHNEINWFCGKCGHCVRRLDNYCSRCGRKVKWND